jgi:hypothetical protein
LLCWVSSILGEFAFTFFRVVLSLKWILPFCGAGEFQVLTIFSDKYLLVGLGLQY